MVEMLEISQCLKGAIPVNTCTPPGITRVRFKLTWSEDEHKHTLDFLDKYFDQTADWSNSVTDMKLIYQTSSPYSRLIVTGDFFVESGWRMDHFALDCSGKVVLITNDDDGCPSYRLLE